MSPVGLSELFPCVPNRPPPSPSLMRTERHREREREGRETPKRYRNMTTESRERKNKVGSLSLSRRTGAEEQHIHLLGDIFPRTLTLILPMGFAPLVQFLLLVLKFYSFEFVLTSSFQEDHIMQNYSFSPSSVSAAAMNMHFSSFLILSAGLSRF